LAAPKLFNLMGAPRGIGLMVVTLVWFSPSNMWWSNISGNVMGYALPGATCLLWGVVRWWHGHRVTACGLMAASAVLLARTVFGYQVWAIVLMPCLLAMVIAWLLAAKGKRLTSVIAVGVTGLSTLALVGVMIWENYSEVTAMAQTLYPGSRRFGSGGTPLWLAFGAPFHAWIEADQGSITASNPSEMSSSFTIVLVAAIMLFVAGRRAHNRRLRWAWTVLAAGTGCWFAWMTVIGGAMASKVPLFNLVAPARAAQVIGMLATVLLGLSLGLVNRGRSRRAAVAGAIVSFLVTAWAGGQERLDVYPQLRASHIVVAAAVVGVITFALIRWPRRAVVWAATAAAALVTTCTANPLMFGVGDMLDSTTARALRAQGAEARASGELWATDNNNLAYLMQANGVPNINRRIGVPDFKGWLALDPTRASEAVWNRGGGSDLLITWENSPDVGINLWISPEGEERPDVISLTISPCILKERFPELTMITSGRDLEPEGYTCLTKVEDLPWNGWNQRVYRVSQP
jgi:hypothetical protein